MGDCYLLLLLLGFATALRFIWRQILCRLYKNPLTETINQGPHVYIYIYVMQIDDLWKSWAEHVASVLKVANVFKHCSTADLLIKRTW